MVTNWLAAVSAFGVLARNPGAHRAAMLDRERPLFDTAIPAPVLVQAEGSAQ